MILKTVLDVRNGLIPSIDGDLEMMNSELIDEASRHHDYFVKNNALYAIENKSYEVTIDRYSDTVNLNAKRLCDEVLNHSSTLRDFVLLQRDGCVECHQDISALDVVFYRVVANIKKLNIKTSGKHDEYLNASSVPLLHDFTFKRSEPLACIRFIDRI